MKLVWYSCFSSKTSCWINKPCDKRCLWLTFWRGTHRILYVCVGVFLKLNGFFCYGCAAIYPNPGTFLAIATRKTEGTETNTSLPIFHTRHNFLKVLHLTPKILNLTWNWDSYCFNPNPICSQILHPNSNHCCQTSAFPRTSASQIDHSRNTITYDNALCHPKILHKHCLKFLLGVKMAPRETENNAYAKFWGDKKEHYGMLLYFLEWSIPWVSFPGCGWGSKLILLFDLKRHLNLKEPKKRKYFNSAEGF